LCKKGLLNYKLSVVAFEEDLVRDVLLEDED